MLNGGAWEVLASREGYWKDDEENGAPSTVKMAPESAVR